MTSIWFSQDLVLEEMIQMFVLSSDKLQVSQFCKMSFVQFTYTRLTASPLQPNGQRSGFSGWRIRWPTSSPSGCSSVMRVFWPRLTWSCAPSFGWLCITSWPFSRCPCVSSGQYKWNVKKPCLWDMNTLPLQSLCSQNSSYEHMWRIRFCVNL